MDAGCCQAHSETVRAWRWSRLRGLAAGVLLAALVAGCTGDVQTFPVPSPTPSPPPVEVGEAETLEPRPVPTEVSVVSVAGRLSRERRRGLARSVRRLVGQWSNAAYLGGDYPRRRFPDSFASFDRGVRDRARRDRDVLSNATVGRWTAAVRPVRREARLHVFAPGGRATGATARVRLVFVTTSRSGAERRVRVSGRLLLGRGADGRWEIFGYDVSRTGSPVRKGARG